MIMKKTLAVFALALGSLSFAAAQTKWTIDPAHSNIKFNVTHLVISEVTGSFDVYEGQVQTKGADFANATASFTADAGSINTQNEKRDGHLKSDDFFNSGKYPKITFQSTNFRKLSDKKYEITGDLTIRDVTKRVVLNADYKGTVQDGYGNTKAAFKATGAINRFDYGLKWNNAVEAGPVVGETVNLDFNIQLTQDKTGVAQKK
jgi:polyisoprenoid-binding protein YceI